MDDGIFDNFSGRKNSNKRRDLIADVTVKLVEYMVNQTKDERLKEVFSKVLPVKRSTFQAHEDELREKAAKDDNWNILFQGTLVFIGHGDLTKLGLVVAEKIGLEKTFAWYNKWLKSVIK